MINTRYMTILAWSLFFTASAQQPKISIITSLYKGGAYIQKFMKNITSQTIFDECELIIIDAHSPDGELSVIAPYLERYPNIIYYRLAEHEEDPGLYGCWNMAIEMGRGDYLVNANVDDLFAPDGLERLAQALDYNPEVDLVYSAVYISRDPRETYEILDYRPMKIILDWWEFSKKNMKIALPGNHPMWRRSMHEKAGLFDASYKAAGDWEMWLRAVEHGSIFMKVPGVLGTFYQGPTCLTKNPIHGQEMDRIDKRYSYIWH